MRLRKKKKNMTGKIMSGAAVAAGVYMIIRWMPDVIRYMKIKSM